jgi:hypothetical protein
MHVVKVTGLTPRERCYPILRYLHNIFLVHILQRIVEIYKLFPSKTAYYVKRQKKIEKFEKLAFYGIDMELELEPEPEP